MKTLDSIKKSIDTSPLLEDEKEMLFELIKSGQDAETLDHLKDLFEKDPWVIPFIQATFAAKMLALSASNKDAWERIVSLEAALVDTVDPIE